MRVTLTSVRPGGIILRGLIMASIPNQHESGITRRLELSTGAVSWVGVFAFLLFHIPYGFAFLEWVKKNPDPFMDLPRENLLPTLSAFLLYISFILLQSLFIRPPDQKLIKTVFSHDSEASTDSPYPIYSCHPLNYFKYPFRYLIPFILYISFYSMILLSWILFSNDTKESADFFGLFFFGLLVLTVAAFGLGVPYHRFSMYGSYLEVYDRGLVLRTGPETCYVPLNAMHRVIVWTREEGLQYISVSLHNNKEIWLDVRGFDNQCSRSIGEQLLNYLTHRQIECEKRFWKRKPLAERRD